MDETLENRVIKFVGDQAGVDTCCLELETTLVGDLAYDGGLGVDFMMNFADEFKVDLSQFDPDKYIPPEPGLIPAGVFRFFGIERKPSQWLPISIRDLVAAAEAGKWKKRQQRAMP
jgi:hypothetical protein